MQELINYNLCIFCSFTAQKVIPSELVQKCLRRTVSVAEAVGDVRSPFVGIQVYFPESPGINLDMRSVPSTITLTRDLRDLIKKRDHDDAVALERLTDTEAGVKNVNLESDSIWQTFSSSLVHTQVMLGGSASAWHRSKALWDMLRTVSVGGIRITGGPVKEERGKANYIFISFLVSVGIDL